MRIIWGLIGITIGTVILWKTYPLVNFFGKVAWAEEHLAGGLGGTYFLYKIMGLAVIIISTLYLFGVLDFILFPFYGLFGGFGDN